MPFSFPEYRQFKGLFLQRNSFSLPDGALEVASNVNISKDGIISSRRGFYTYFTPGSGTLKRLFNYGGKLLAIFDAKISYFTDTGSSPNETGTETTLTGSTVLVSAVGTPRTAQANSNLYVTSDNGVLKLTGYASSITNAGAPQALDLNVRFAESSTAFTEMTASQAMAYRYLFGYTDANGSLILSAPSDIVPITNSLRTAQAYTSAGGGPYTITVTSTAHGLATGTFLLFSAGSSVNANGTYSITVATVDTFTYSEATGDPTSGTLSWCYQAPVRLECSIPVGNNYDITTSLSWFYQVYRTSIQASTAALSGDFKLINQTTLTAAEIGAGVFIYLDAVPVVLLGANLYTNENSGEGEAQANTRPPYCKDITTFKGYSLYGNCTLRESLFVNVVDSTVLSANDYVETSLAGSGALRYVAKAGIANRTTKVLASSSSGLLLTFVAHGFSNGWYIYVSSAVGGTLATGFYYVVSAAADTFKISLTLGGTAVAYPASVTSVDVQALTDGTNRVFYFDTSSSPSIRLFNTAYHLVKAINRNSSSTIYAKYVSGVNDVPGKMWLQTKGTSSVISLRANTTTAGAAFSPALPSSFGAAVSINSALPNHFFASKLNEPEAVPLVNFFPVGSKAKNLLRIMALRDSVIIVKEDGLYRMTGDTPSNFSITVLDSTIQCVAADSADIINNQVILLSNQGFVLISESSVEIISRNIEDIVQPILGQSGLSAQTAAVAYETERMYLCSTTQPATTTQSITNAYNVLTGAWTTWDHLLVQGAIGPGDVCYTISSSNDIKRERKKQTRLDYVGQQYSVTLATLASDGLSGTLTSAAYVPLEGDVLVKSSVITRITAATLVSGTTYAVTLSASTNLVAADSLTLYAAYTKAVKLAPVHGGSMGRMKFFSQMMVHLKDDNLSKATVYFTNDSFSGSEVTHWEPTALASSGGWGAFPWGFLPWGQTAGISITQGTNPAPIMRIFIPSFAARSSFIQPYLEMKNGADVLNIQAISFAVRAYGERESK